MKETRVFPCLMLLLMVGSGCRSFIGIARTDDAVYLTGTTSFIFTRSWVMRCEESGPELRCRELSVVAAKEPVTQAGQRAGKGRSRSGLSEEGD